MNRLLVVMAFAACAPEPRGPDAPDASNLPAGVWEPDPGPGRYEASLVSQDGEVWFAYTKFAAAEVPQSTVWLARTESTGERLIVPARVDELHRASSLPTIARSAQGVTVAYMVDYDRDVSARAFGHDGSAIAPSSPSLYPVGVIGSISRLQLVEAAGGTRLLAAFENETSEVFAVGLDASARPTGESAFLGTPDDGSPTGLAAAAAQDGAALIAWDRQYDQCYSQKPAMTFAGSIAPSGSTAPARAVLDTAGLSETSPAIAAKGASAYVAWTVNLTSRSMISLARFDDVSTVVAEVGNVNEFNQQPRLALAEPGRGAIAWVTSDPFTLHVASLRDAGLLEVGAAHVIPPVSENDEWIALRGLVHVRDEQFVVAWTEGGTGDQSRLYATSIDLATEAPRQAPRLHAARPPASPRIDPRRAASRPCSH